MRRNSIAALFAVAVLVGFVIADQVLSLRILADEYTESRARRVAALRHEITLARWLLKANQDLTVLEAMLNDRRSAYAYQIWALVMDGRIYRSSLPLEDWPRLSQVIPSERDAEILRDEYIYRRSAIGEGVDLVLASSYSQTSFLMTYYRDWWIYKLEGILVVFLIAVGAFSFYFRDINLLLTRLRRPSTSEANQVEPLKSEPVRPIATRSHEAQLLQQTLNAFDMKIRTSENEAQVLRAQVLPSLRQELLGGRQEAYEFDCTLVRLDVNSYSTLILGPHRSEFETTLHDFFEQCVGLVELYGGLVHEFIGDEVLFYIKDQAAHSSLALALLALRDMHLVAERLSESSAPRFRFSVKSSISRGSLRFSPFLDGFHISGYPLIESVRLLSQAPSQSEHLATARVDLFSGEPILEGLLLNTRRRVAMKGLSGDTEVVEVALQRFDPLSVQAGSATHDTNSVHPFQSPFAKYQPLLRRPEDLAKWLPGTFTDALGSGQDRSALAWKQIQELTNGLNARSRHTPSLVVQSELLALTPVAGRSTEGLSALIKILEWYIQPASLPQDAWMSLIREVERLADPRVLSQLIDLHAEHPALLDLSHDLLNRNQVDTPRVQCARWTLQGQRELSTSLLSELRRALSQSQQSDLTLAAAASLARIAGHWSRRAPIAWAANTDWTELTREISESSIAQRLSPRTRELLLSALATLGRTSQSRGKAS